jgi:hypothetical protein
MVTYQDNLYTYGGRGEQNASAELWEFSFAAQGYSKIASNSQYASPTPSAFMQCHIYNGRLYVLGGSTDDTAPPHQIHSFDFFTSSWRVDSEDHRSMSSSVSELVGSQLITIGGNRWNNLGYYEISIFDMNSLKFTYKNAEPGLIQYGMAGVYFKNSFYIFGGGDIPA